MHPFKTSLVLAVTTAAAIFARPSFSSELGSIQDICSQLHDARAQLRLSSPERLLWDTLRVELDPASLVRLHETRLPVDQGHRVSLQSQGSRNVIFSIDPPTDLATSQRMAAQLERYDEVTRQLTGMVPRLRKIASSATVEQCVARAQSMNFDFDAFVKLSTERNALALVEQIRESRIADSVLAGLSGHLRLRWEVIHSTEVMDVHQALAGGDVRNLVILSHGVSDGTLVDSRMSEYPDNFFEDLPPGLRSLTLFACHGEEIAKRYRFAANLAGAPSSYPDRLLIVSDGTELAGLGELVPVKAFGRFMRRVDRALSVAQEPVPSGQPEAGDAFCDVEIPGFDVTLGTFGVALNGHFVGAVQATQNDPRLQYPCSWADRARNVLIIRSLSLMEPAQLQSTSFGVTPQHPGQAVVDPILTVFKHDDGSFEGAKLIFGLGPSVGALWRNGN